MLDNLKALLGLPEEDISQDKKLQLILDAASFWTLQSYDSTGLDQKGFLLIP